MARRKTDLDAGLELWARWSLPGGAVSGGRSMLAKLIDNKGELFFGSGGPGGGMPVDGIEWAIEAVVLSMFTTDPMRADVLRLEYGAADYQVADRRKIVDYDPAGLDQYQKAHALGISRRTYMRRLAEARETLATQLRLTP
jgi:hypothetical protein